MGAYTKKTYVNDTTPALSATNLNSTEQGAYDAHQEIANYASAMVGVIMYFPWTSAPTGWVACDGSQLSTSTYSALYAVIGTTFGSGSGTFAVPDLRGRFIRGWDNGVGRDSGRTFGSVQADDVSYHCHSFTDQNFTGNQTEPVASGLGSPYNSTTTTDTTSTVPTSGDSHPKNVAMLACIKY